MPDNYTKAIGYFFCILQCLEYGHLPNETYRYPVRSVVRLSQCFGPGSKVIATSYVCYEEVQIGFHRIEFDTGKISPRGAVIPFSTPSEALVTDAVSYIPFTKAFHFGRKR